MYFFFQPILKVIVTIQDETYGEKEMDLSQQLPDFTPFHLIYCVNLVQLDLSGCDYFRASDLEDSVQRCQRLQHLSLVGCYQLREYQLVRMFCNLKDLEYINCSDTDRMHFASAYWVVSSLSKLTHFYFDERFPHYERRDWAKFKRIFDHLYTV